MDCNMKKKIKIIDTAFAHCNYSNNPTPPIQDCDFIEWDRTLPIPPDEILFVTENNITNPNIFKLPNKKYAWLLECRFFSKNPYIWITHNYNKYDYVLTHDRALVEMIPNALWTPVGGCWVDKKDWCTNHNKKNLVSMMISDKKQLIGHSLRHQIKSLNLGIDIFGRGTNPIDYKITALETYKYHICIENSMVEGYFTEKLIDCFMTGTIPIYWGDPKIDKIFDISGMILVENLDDIIRVVSSLEELDYDSFLKGMETNFNLAKDYILAENYIHKNYNYLIK